MGRISTPFASVGTNSIDTPSMAERVASPVRASTINHCARVAPDVHILWPLRRHPPALSRSARVFMMRAISVPPSGSLSENDTFVRAATRSARIARCSSVDANAPSTWMIMYCTIMNAAIDVGPAASSSITTS